MSVPVVVDTRKTKTLPPNVKLGAGPQRASRVSGNLSSIDCPPTVKHPPTVRHPPTLSAAISSSKTVETGKMGTMPQPPTIPHPPTQSAASKTVKMGTVTNHATPTWVPSSPTGPHPPPQSVASAPSYMTRETGTVTKHAAFLISSDRTVPPDTGFRRQAVTGGKLLAVIGDEVSVIINLRLIVSI